MSTLPVHEPDPLLDRIEAALQKSGEVVLTRNDSPIARVLPPESPRPIPSRAALRATMPRLTVSSAEHIRADRDER